MQTQQAKEFVELKTLQDIKLQEMKSETNNQLTEIKSQQAEMMQQFTQICNFIKDSTIKKEDV